MSARLVIFIDAFPYTALNSAPFVRSLGNVARLVPGLGYSINNYSELFAGRLPDEVGFLNEWTYKPEGSEFWKYRRLLRALSPLQSSYYADWVSHRLLGRAVGYLGFVPYAYLPWLGRCGTRPFAGDYPFPSVLDAPRLEVVSYTDLDAAPYDERASRLGLEAVSRSDQVFITLVDLDCHTHVHGVHTEEHQKKVGQLDATVRQLSESFWGRHPGAAVCVLSDHGMVNVATAIGVDFESRFGRALPSNGYCYFSDMTMLRVWIESDRLFPLLREYLTDLPGGRLLTQDERRRFGVVRREFGDLIYVLEAGNVFVPGFWSRRKIPKAMHGYVPGADDLYGIVASNRSLPGKELSTLSTYGWLRGLLEDIDQGNNGDSV